jgi:hypothetical protein
VLARSRDKPPPTNSFLNWTRSPLTLLRRLRKLLHHQHLWTCYRLRDGLRGQFHRGMRREQQDGHILEWTTSSSTPKHKSRTPRLGLARLLYVGAFLHILASLSKASLLLCWFATREGNNGGRTLVTQMQVPGGGSNMSVEACLAACTGFTYGGVEYSQECCKSEIYDWIESQYWTV